MHSGPNVLAIYVMEMGKTLGAHARVIERLKNRLQLRRVHSENECDVVIAFVPIVSRAGTDIAATLQKIKASRPVVLVVLHYTLDQNYIAPQSKWSVDAKDMFAVDFLFNEDDGLLRNLHNDESLKSITDYLIFLGASPNVMQYDSSKCFKRRTCWRNAFLVLFSLVFVAGLIVMFLSIFGQL